MEQPDERTRTVEREIQERRCARCGEWFEFQQPQAKYCSETCRQVAYQQRKAAERREAGR